MAFRYIVDMDQVETGIEKAGHAPARGFNDDAPGGSRLHVAGSDRRRWIDDHHRKPFARHHLLNQPFGGDLAPLVGPHTFLDLESDGFVGRRAVIVQRQGGDAAGIDNSLDAGPFCLLHHNACAVDVGSKNLVRAAGPEPIIGGYVKDISDASHGPPHRRCVAHVARGELQIESIELKSRTAGAHQRPNREALGEQLSRYR